MDPLLRIIDLVIIGNNGLIITVIICNNGLIITVIIHYNDVIICVVIRVIIHVIMCNNIANNT
jgi:hypothetical protein